MAPPTKRERAAEARASSSKPGAALPPPGGAADGERRRMDQPPNFLLRLPRLLPAHHPPDPTLQIASATLPALFDITDPKLFPAPSTQDHHQQLRVPCRAGICTTPIQITSSQLVSNEIFPPAVVKAMLYPGAIVSNLTTSMSMTFPRWSDLFDIYNLIEAKNASAVIDLKRLEMLAGSYFCVAGALVGIINPGRMILFGTLLVIWGLVKDALFRKPVDSELTEPVYVYPTILIALICSFMSITYNIKKKARSSQSVSISKPLQSSAKSKLK